MAHKQKYNPEDIEYLLLNKPFTNLLEAEREFVLQHIQNEQQYEAMRQTLKQVHKNFANDNTITPRKESRAKVMAAFAKKNNKSGIVIWLNSFYIGLFPPQKGWYLQPGFQMAFAVLVIAFLWLFFIGDMNTATTYIAENKIENPSVPKEINKEEDFVNSNTKSIKSETNNIETNTIPAPKYNELQITENNINTIKKETKALESNRTIADVEALGDEVILEDDMEYVEIKREQKNTVVEENSNNMYLNEIATTSQKTKKTVAASMENEVSRMAMDAAMPESTSTINKNKANKLNAKQHYLLLNLLSATW